MKDISTAPSFYRNLRNFKQPGLLKKCGSQDKSIKTALVLYRLHPFFDGRMRVPNSNTELAFISVHFVKFSNFLKFICFSQKLLIRKAQICLAIKTKEVKNESFSFLYFSFLRAFPSFILWAELFCCYAEKLAESDNRKQV